MFYVPRFSPSPPASGGGGGCRCCCCWLCERPCGTAGYPNAPRLFFPPRTDAVTSPEGNPNPNPNPNPLPLSEDDGVSSFTLCETCAEKIDGQIAFAEPRRVFNASGQRWELSPSGEFVAAVQAYKKLLTTLSVKVIAASRAFAGAAALSPTAGRRHCAREEDGGDSLVEVTADTALSATTPQLQSKLLRLLVQHLEEVTLNGFQNRNTSRGSASYHGTGPDTMTQEERNYFLREMLVLERALSTTTRPSRTTLSGKKSIAGGKGITQRTSPSPPPAASSSSAVPSVVELLSSPASYRNSKRQLPDSYHYDSIAERQRFTRELSSLSPNRKETGTTLTETEKTIDEQSPPPHRLPSNRRNRSNSVRDHEVLDSLVWHHLSHAASHHPLSPWRQDDHREPNTGESDSGQANRDAVCENGDGGDLLLKYFAQRLRTPHHQLVHTADAEDNLRKGSRDGTADNDRQQISTAGRPKGAFSDPAAPSAALTTLPAVAEGHELTALENLLRDEVARRRGAEQALSDAYTHIAALEKTTSDMGKRLLATKLSFLPAFHLDHLNDFYATVVTFFQLFCLRKSMLFGEEVAALMRDVTRRSGGRRIATCNAAAGSRGLGSTRGSAPASLPQ